MSLFQLDSKSLAERALHSGRGPLRLGASLLRGVLGFALVSVCGFAPWAFAGSWFYPLVGEAGLYAICAGVFIGFSGVFLHRLIMGAGSLSRFYKLFALGFAAYATTWILCWLEWGNRGTLPGLIIGTTLMASIIALAFDTKWAAWKVLVALFGLSTAGYYSGAWVYDRLQVQHLLLSMLLWGVCYGVGFGAGLGLAFYLAQERARALWRELSLVR